MSSTVLSLQTEITDLQNELSIVSASVSQAVNESISSINKSVATLETSISQVSAGLSTSQVSISNLETNVATLETSISQVSAGLSTVQTNLENSISTAKNELLQEIENSKVTKEDLELDKVDNTSDMDKPVSTATQQAIDDAIASIEFTTEAGAELNSGTLEDPLVSSPIKDYINSILSGTDTQINEDTGKLEIPILNTLIGQIEALQAEIEALKQ